MDAGRRHLFVLQREGTLVLMEQQTAHWHWFLSPPLPGAPSPMGVTQTAQMDISEGSVMQRVALQGKTQIWETHCFTISSKQPPLCPRGDIVTFLRIALYK